MSEIRTKNRNEEGASASYSSIKSSALLSGLSKSCHHRWLLQSSPHPARLQTRAVFFKILEPIIRLHNSSQLLSRTFKANNLQFCITIQFTIWENFEPLLLVDQDLQLLAANIRAKHNLILPTRYTSYAFYKPCLF